MIKREEIRIRDPFIYTDIENGCYYMYGSTNLIGDGFRTETKFSVYRSYDLENFEEPKVIFDGSKIGFWSDRDYWAPEMHKYNGKYYLFGNFKSETRHRSTHILVCDTPDGEFVPLTEEPITPLEWECLDGTFWIENGKPYLVFSHEWTQIGDGEIWAMQLSDDLKRAVAEPFMLFRASDNPTVIGIDPKGGGFVTDGPFLYSEDGKTKMIWSSFGEKGYLVLDAWSDSINGEWHHGGSRFDFDGGHAMIFETLEGEKMISLHSPNTLKSERASFYKWK